MEASGHQSFIEKVSILTISMFFIVIYSYNIICIYFDILLYDVLQLLRPYRRTSMSIDISVFVFTIDATIDATFSFNVPHAQVCVTLDKFTIMISLFFDILKFIIFLCFYMLQDHGC
jgi:hypothetical protein